VAKASPAELAGLQKGDVIRFAAGKKILHTKDLQDLMKSLKVDEVVSLVIERQGERKELPVKIGNLPDVPLAELFPKSSPVPTIPPGK
jgi:serine protease Do